MGGTAFHECALGVSDFGVRVSGVGVAPRAACFMFRVLGSGKNKGGGSGVGMMDCTEPKGVKRALRSSSPMSTCRFRT